MVVRIVRLVALAMCLFGMQVQAADWLLKKIPTTITWQKKPKPMHVITSSDAASRPINLKETAGSISSRFGMMKTYIDNTKPENQFDSEQKALQSRDEIRKELAKLRNSTFVPKESIERRKLLDFISVAADPYIFKVVDKQGKEKAILDAVEQIKNFDMVDITNVGEKPKPEDDQSTIEDEPFKDLSVSEMFFGGANATLKDVLSNLEGLLYEPILKEMQQRVNNIAQWGDIDARNAALLLLAAYELERNFFEAHTIAKKRDDNDSIYKRSVPLFDVIKKFDLSLPVKRSKQGDATVYYDLGKYGVFRDKDIIKFASLGNGDVLRGFCKAKQNKAMVLDADKEGVYNEMCSLAPATYIAEKKLEKKEVDKDFVDDPEKKVRLRALKQLEQQKREEEKANEIKVTPVIEKTNTKNGGLTDSTVFYGYPGKQTPAVQIVQFKLPSNQTPSSASTQKTVAAAQPSLLPVGRDYVSIPTEEPGALTVKNEQKRTGAEGGTLNITIDTPKITEEKIGEPSEATITPLSNPNPTKPEDKDLDKKEDEKKVKERELEKKTSLTNTQASTSSTGITPSLSTTKPQAPQPRGFFYNFFSTVGNGFGYLARTVASPFVIVFKAVGSFFGSFWR